MELRAVLRLWGRLLAYLVVLAVVIAAVSGLLVGEEPSPGRQVLGLAGAVPAVLGLTYAFRRWVDRRSWDGIGLPVPRWRHLWQWSAGFAAGVLAVAVLFGVEWALGWVEVAGTELDERAAGAVVGLLVGGLALQVAAGFTEEVAFRGYVFANLAERMRLRDAALMVGLLFGAVHLPAATSLASGLTWTVGVNTVAGGVLISSLWVLMRLSSGTLWPAIGMHAAWNWAESWLFGLTTTAEPGHGDALLHVQQSGPGFIVGGEVPETGLLFTLGEALLLGGYWLWLRRDRVRLRAGFRVADQR